MLKSGSIEKNLVFFELGLALNQNKWFSLCMMKNTELITLADSKGFGLGKIKGGFELWSGKGDAFTKITFTGSRADFINFLKEL